MATSEGHTSDFYIVLTNMENQPSRFDHEPEYNLYYRSPIVLNPNVEWEAAIIDAYIPTPQKETVVSKGMSPYKHHWFRYIVSVERRSMNADDYFSYRKWYYSPHDQESVVHSCIKKVNEVQKRHDTYGDFTYPYYPDKLKLFVNDDDHFCIRINSLMVHPLEAISIQMPVAQIAQFFGNSVEFETWYKNKRLKLKIGHSPFIVYDSRDECLRIEKPLRNPYIEEEENMNPLMSNPMMGVVFKSKEKIKRPAKATTTITHKETPKLIDIECSLVQTTRLGKMEGGTRVMDIVREREHENINPKYIKLDSRIINSVFLNFVDSETKKKIRNITNDVVIVVHIRPCLS